VATVLDGQGATLAAFAYYAMCQANSSRPRSGTRHADHLVQAAFAQIARSRGGRPEHQHPERNNPTFTPSVRTCWR